MIKINFIAPSYKKHYKHQVLHIKRHKMYIKTGIEIIIIIITMIKMGIGNLKNKVATC